jgi:Zn-dependent protease
MYGSSNPRDNPLNWSFKVGKAFGIDVRVHIIFVIWIAFLLLRDAVDGFFLSGVVVSVILFLTVLVHEYGHCFGARAVGGDAHEILMWPLGGLAMVHAPMTPRAQFITVVAGPAVNVAGCLISALVMVVLGSAGRIPIDPLNLFLPAGSPTGWGLTDWVLCVWVINYILLLFNLLPTFPMDGGRILQAVLWHRSNYRTATMHATFVGMIGAVVYGLIGLVAKRPELVGIAIFGYLECTRQRTMIKHGEFMGASTPGGFDGGYDFADSLAEPKHRKRSWFERRRARKATARADRDQQRRQDLQAEIDRILDKVHRQGIQSLTDKEKKTLAQGTAQHRND